MDRIGLTFEEWAELKVRPRVGASAEFQRAAEMHLAEMFPMTLMGASSHLRGRGYDCRPDMLDVLIENGVVKLASTDAWSRADVDAAAEHFEECGIYTPYAAMCMALGCRYADFERALREAASRESAKYGRRIPDDDQYFVMHRVPPRGIIDPSGKPAGVKPAVITFTLCDDIRERIERGEEV
ncbi:MAG: hypothetical protein BWX88_04617 [Planctomycetes bacterium ADurb.Bin126]|nr:MAG: hypothetical protein BWX88_04617 [Planctomycetes bacterium ADurb.Bin126]HOD83930.1 hypothetical protein [Phycisphaerae bacterium]HQL76229.1 hypothetical protein [Phycisphaerae bacterium]